MRKKKNKRWLVVGFILILVIILILLINFSGNNGVNTSLNLSEKRWIENNKNDVINISVANNIPVFSNDGDGVFFDFIERLESETSLSLNLISYEVSDGLVENDLYFEVINHDDVLEIGDDEMVFFTDYYVLVASDSERISDPSEISNKNIGVLSDDLSAVSYYITSQNGITYTPYESESSLQAGMNNGEVDYIAIPRMRFLSYILENDYHIVYNITEVKEAYVLRTSSELNKNLISIVNKNYLNYEYNYLEDEYNQHLIGLLMDKNDISEKTQADFLGKEYVFGYIENEPYTSVVNNRLIGLDSTYIDAFSELSGATITIEKYRSVSALKDALNNNEVDFAPNYYNFSGLSGDYVTTLSPYTEEYVVLVSNDRTDLVVNSIKSLNDMDVITTNSGLAKYVEDETDANVKTYDRVSSLLNNVNSDSIVILDKNVYDTYKDSELFDFRVIYNDSEDLEYGYIIKQSDENAAFSTLFTTYMEIINYKQMYNLAWKNYLSDSKEISYNFLYFVAAVLILLILWLFLRKKIKIRKKVKREETIRYVDPLTSLKNRNYLNKNFKRWNNNAIYPQSIIVINLNNLRHVNDVYGHEEGDKLIKLAANVLIRNQLEQSDIIRTDGNEYLIYMVGYEKNKVVAYMRKLYKELSELPYGYGATLGYSMIEDDIKTIDDAINEAVLEIRASKEMNDKGK